MGDIQSSLKCIKQKVMIPILSPHSTDLHRLSPKQLKNYRWRTGRPP